MIAWVKVKKYCRTAWFCTQHSRVKKEASGRRMFPEAYSDKYSFNALLFLENLQKKEYSSILGIDLLTFWIIKMSKMSKKCDISLYINVSRSLKFFPHILLAFLDSFLLITFFIGKFQESQSVIAGAFSRIMFYSFF